MNDLSDEEFIGKKFFFEVVKALEEKIRTTDTKIDSWVSKTEDLAQKQISFAQIKQELIAFFSMDGYSEAFATSNPSKKIFCLMCLTTLFIIGIKFICQSITEYKEFNVLTQVKSKLSESLIFPAISFCLSDIRNSPVTVNLNDIFADCYFENRINVCTITDFEPFNVTNPRKGSWDSCYKFNGGKFRNNTNLLKSNKFGKYTGLVLNVTLPKTALMTYYVGDNHVRPIYTEFTKTVQTGKTVFVGIKKNVDQKLPYPYDDCQESITPETSALVRRLLAQNITYRKKNCYDLCVQDYAARMNLAVDSVYNNDTFSFEEMCSKYCPTECNSNIFIEDQNEIAYENSSYLRINFYFAEGKYIEMIQLPKISGAELVSNAGGILGLLLDISFYHFYKLLVYVLDLVIF